MNILLWVWLVAGFFSFGAVFISMYQIYGHLRHYSQPILQRKILGIIWMVPIYAICSWLSLRFKDMAIYLDMLRDCYEAYVIYIFFALMVAYIGKVDAEEVNEQKVVIALAHKGSMPHPFPVNLFLDPMPLDRAFLRRCKAGTLQFVVVKPLTAFIGIWLEMRHLLDEGEMRMDRGYIYLSIIRNASVTLSMYFLVLFYLSTKEPLAPYKPVPKFLCIKAVLFFSFWQGVAISVLVSLGLIHEAGSYTTENVSTSLQNMLICFEMFLASFAHDYAFTWKDYETASPRPLEASLLKNAFDVTDLVVDFNEVSPFVIPSGFKPKLLVSEARGKVEESEMGHL